MKAWQITNEYEGNSVVVFCDHGLKARRLGANELDIQFDEVECKRTKEYDQFSELGFVPDSVCLASGWWFECSCGKQITGEDEYFLPEVISHNKVFCSKEHYERSTQ